MYYGTRDASEFEEDYLEQESLGALGAAIGPKQKECLASGGRWEGPEGKKKCVTGRAPDVARPADAAVTQFVQATQQMAAVRKQAEAAAAATAAAKKKAEAAMGPKQKACLAKGGTWSGPKGKMACVMPGQTITPDQPVEVSPTKLATSSVGPN